MPLYYFICMMVLCVRPMCCPKGSGCILLPALPCAIPSQLSVPGQGGTAPPAHTSCMHPPPPCSIQCPCGAGGLQGVCLLLAPRPRPQRCQPCRAALMQHPWLQHPHSQPVVGDPWGERDKKWVPVTSSTWEGAPGPWREDPAPQEGGE